MKYFPSQFDYFLRNRPGRRNLKLLLRFLLLLAIMVTVYSAVFRLLMAQEGREFSWVTGFYWTLTTMSTLGFGDITFASDAGRFFSMWVLLSGMVFLLVLLPFTFIQFFYAPWMEAQSASRAPKELPRDTANHVVLTHYDEVTAALINKLTQYHSRYVLLAPDLPEALRLHDLGLKVVVGDLSNPETYRRVRVERATLVATTCSDVVNTNVASTVREMSATVPLIATANFAASVDILELAGCTHVLELGEMMGKSLARRTIGGDAMAHVIGEFDQLLIAEATAARTPLVGKTLRECRLRERANITVVGVWDRGHFQTAGPETCVSPNTVLVLAGSQSQLDSYNRLFSLYSSSKAPVVIIGGGRVGRATGHALAERGMDYCIVEQLRERIRDPEKYVLGNAAELEILKKAGIMEAANVVITTHDDDTNVYLTIYCRRLRPEIQIIARATLDRNISTLHRAGADFVMSYASMGANTIFNLLKRGDILMVTEGLDVFRRKLPASLAGRTIAETSIPQETGCSIIAVNADHSVQINPDPTVPLPADTEVILIGTAEAEHRFLELYGD